jgi:hypothetical protein
MKKSDVQNLYTEVKRRKVSEGKKQGLIEPRPAKRCNCGKKTKKA